MFKKTFLLILSFSAMLLAAGNSQANTIVMDTYQGGGDDSVTCNGTDFSACLGFVGMTPVSLDSAQAYDYPQETNPASELVALNDLLAAMDPAVDPVSGANDLNATRSFITNKEYFAIKQATKLYFFKNTSGGALNVALTVGTASFSHATEFGAVVPVPAAVWLFGSGLLGLVAVSRRKAR